MKQIYSELKLLHSAKSNRAIRANIVDHPLVRDSLLVLRNKNTSISDFRHAIKSLSYHLIYSATISLKEQEVTISTPLAEFVGTKIADKVVLIPVLRSGLGMLEPALEIFPTASVIFAGMARDETTSTPQWYYDLKTLKHLGDGGGVVFIMLDPMLATGGSALATATRINELYPLGRIHLISAIASVEGIAMLNKKCKNLVITVAAVDDHLNEQKYIVPGLGDAGDRQFDVLNLNP